MKTRIYSAIALLKSLEDNYHVREPGMVAFKQAMGELQGAVDMPAPEPVTITKTEVATEAMATAVASALDAVLTQIHSETSAALTGITARLGNVETAAASMMTIGQANTDMLNGMEDVLGVIQANTAPAA